MNRVCREYTCMSESESFAKRKVPARLLAIPSFDGDCIDVRFAGFINANCKERDVYVGGTMDEAAYGWPVHAIIKFPENYDLDGNFAFDRYFLWRGILIDLSVFLISLALCALLSEWLIRRREGRKPQMISSRAAAGYNFSFEHGHCAGWSPRYCFFQNVRSRRIVTHASPGDASIGQMGMRVRWFCVGWPLAIWYSGRA